MKKKILIVILMVLISNVMSAKDFIFLTNQQMAIDSVLPQMSCFFDMPKNYLDSDYQVRLLYPEYTPLKRKQRRQLAKLLKNDISSGISNAVNFDKTYFQQQKKTMMRATFMPIVKHKGRLCFVSSFLPALRSTAKNQQEEESLAAKSSTLDKTLLSRATADDASSASVYAENSVLSTGKWAKISVTSSGIYQLTDAVIKKAGFSDLSKVKIYGYGGALVPERLTQSYLRSTDDLQEVASCMVNGKRLFYANGPVNWDTKTTAKRTRNPYSDYGYYFITEGTDDFLTCTQEELSATFYADPYNYHYLYENDKYAWAEVGRNLVDGTPINSGITKTFNVVIPSANTTANVIVVVTSGTACTYSVQAAGTTKSGSLSPTGSYDVSAFTTLSGFSFTKAALDTLSTRDANGNFVVPIEVSCTSGGPIRIDYISAMYSVADSVNYDSTFPTAEYVYNITNQNHHADEPVDLVIIIPTSQKLLAQAERIAECHRTNDGMTVRIVPADELYNEFSSGTPDMSAYKRYLKMFYDKASDSDGMIKYCLLFGDCVWDNRMATLSSSAYNVDDYLLCYNTENSQNMIYAVTADDFICVLQDGKKIHVDDNREAGLQLDCAVGRIPVVTPTQAQAVVDKIVNYINNGPQGQWQNEMLFVGDDGDNNSHMSNINANADAVMERSPGYNLKKVMFDAYEKRNTSKGSTYPDVDDIVAKKQKEGALIINYGGHASWTQLADEKIVQLADFENYRNTNYPLWFTAACETMPFQMTISTLGESALLNADGGAVGFIGTVGTVLEEQNTRLDKYFMKYVLDYDADGKPYSVGDALRMAKNSLVTGSDLSIGTDLSQNKHHYHLLGDPAMRLMLPTYTAVVDYIDGTDITDGDVALISGGSIVEVTGHIETRSGAEAADFNGKANITIYDSQQTITCLGQMGDTPMSFSDYDSKLFVGTCNVVDGKFTFRFRLSGDIYDDGGNGKMIIYALDETKRASANGETTNFSAQGWIETRNDSIGPSIYAYLNNASFVNGSDVGPTPYFVAEVTDNDGINVTGSSVGHNLELIVDGKASMTYDLNDNFVFDDNSYISGQTYYVLPTLDEGYHTLSFRAWDMLNNTNSVTLNFRVVKNMTPTISDISVGPNPIRSTATFYVTHDMQGSDANIRIEIIDMMGRLVEELQWSDTFSETNPVSSYRWTPSGVSPGLYLYRVSLSCDGHNYSSKTKKLIIAQ